MLSYSWRKYIRDLFLFLRCLLQNLLLLLTFVYYLFLRIYGVLVSLFLLFGRYDISGSLLPPGLTLSLLLAFPVVSLNLPMHSEFVGNECKILAAIEIAAK